MKLSVEPIKIDRYPLPDTPAEALTAEFMGVLRDGLGAMLTESSFSAAGVPDRLVNIAATFAPDAIMATVHREERQHPFDTDQPPLRTMLGNLAIGQKMVPQLTLDDGFTANIQSQVRAYNFEELETYHRVLSGTGIVGLLGSVHALSQRQENGWLSDIYALVADSTRHPEDYTPPIDVPESLYLLCFVPSTARRLTRRLLVNNMIAARMEQAVGSEADSDSQAMLSAFRQYFTADALEGQNWTDLIREHSFSHESAITLAFASADKLKALASMQRLLREGKGADVIERWREVTTELSRVMSQVDGESSLDIWRSIDIGHAFEGFKPYSLQGAFQPSWGLHKEFADPPKTGGKAVILEDDTEQLVVWRAVVGDHTPYTVHDELCHAEPDGVVEREADPDVGLFLLDIQNGEDTTAGIRVAQEILENRLSGANPDGLQPGAKQLKVIVWSTSSQSVDLASANLQKFLDSLPRAQKELVSYWLPGKGGHSWSRSPVNIEVRLKGWKDY